MIDDVAEPPAPPVSASAVVTAAVNLTPSPQPRSAVIANIAVVILSLVGLTMLATYLLAGAP